MYNAHARRLGMCVCATPASTIPCPNVELLLAHRLRRWANSKSTLRQHYAFQAAALVKIYRTTGRVTEQVSTTVQGVYVALLFKILNVKCWSCVKTTIYNIYIYHIQYFVRIFATSKYMYVCIHPALSIDIKSHLFRVVPRLENIFVKVLIIFAA